MKYQHKKSKKIYRMFGNKVVAGVEYYTCRQIKNGFCYGAALVIKKTMLEEVQE